jgi:hypothetical protein
MLGCCRTRAAREQSILAFYSPNMVGAHTDSPLSPEIVVTGSYIQIGHVALHHYFEQLIPTEPNNQLILSVRLAPYKSFMVENPPQAVTHKLTAGAAPDCSRIVWVGIGAGGGRLGQLDSATLAEFAADLLVEYYCKHTKR